MEYAIMGNGFLTKYDAIFLRDKYFIITGFYALGKDEIMITLKEIEDWQL